MLGHQQTVSTAALSIDGRRVTTGSRDHTVKVWDAETGRLLLDLSRHRAAIERVAFSRDGRRIVSRSADHTARGWDAATGVELARFSVPDLRAALLLPDRVRVVTASRRQLKLWPVRHPHLR